MKAISKMLPHCRLIALLFLIGLPAPGNATEEPESVIQKAATDLIEIFKTQPITGGKEQIKQIVDEVLSPVIDFRRIAYRSMGKYYKRASPQQFLAFTEAVQISLINTYSGPLLESDAQELAKKLSVEIYRSKTIEGRSRRKIVSTWLKVGSTEKYDVVYYMYLNTKKELWLVENVSVEGIDIGINFRNQYQRLISENRGDLDKVTEIWAKSKIEG